MGKYTATSITKINSSVSISGTDNTIYTGPTLSYAFETTNSKVKINITNIRFYIQWRG